MRKPSKIKTAGFEFLPEGQLLTQFVDFDHAIGAAYERCIGYQKDFHTHDRINLAFPRCSSIIKFVTKDPADKFTIDEGSILWMPANVVHSQDTASVIYDNLAIFPEDSVVDAALKRVGEGQSSPLKLPVKTTKAARSALLDGLLNQYFFDRVLQKKAPHTIDELSRQILDEVLRILTKTKVPHDSINFQSQDTVALRAIQWIESNLFAKFSVSTLAAFSRTSPATLFRKFKEATGLTPHEYLRRRRLDEAKHLLRTGDYSVGDVALLVGYEDLSAFSKAFTKEFKVTPSSLKA